MTWIACGFCHQIPCQCQWNRPQPVAPMVPVYQPVTFTPLPQRLSDEDVERIAKRLAELLREPAKAEPVAMPIPGPGTPRHPG